MILLRKPILVAAAVLMLCAMPAMSATTIQGSATGTWSSVDSPDTVGLKGVGTSGIKWGAPVYPRQQSGYSFTGITQSQPIMTDTVFDIGVFTHENRAIRMGTSNPFSITGASLTVSVVFMLSDGISRTISAVFDFEHWETLNEPAGLAACADGGKYGVGVNAKGCADRVTLDRNDGLSESIEIDGIIYELDITGFLANGALFTSFWTVEGMSNRALLQGILRTRAVPVDDPPDGGPGTPPVAPVPLPAGGWLLLAGLGGLASLRRLRRPS